MRHRIRWFGVLLALAVIRPAAAADVRFEAEVDRDRVEVGERVVLTVTVSVPDGSKIEELELPEPPGFAQVSRGQSTRMQLSFGTGGRGMEHVVSHRVVLEARSEGVQIIGRAVLRYGGRTHQTEPIQVRVEEEGTLGRRPPPSGGRAPGGRPRSPFEGLFEDPFEALQEPQRELGPRDVFVRVEADGEEVWLGQQVTLQVEVWSRVEIGDFPSFRMPSLDGFWVEDLDSPTRIMPTRRTVDGVPYRVYLLRRQALFPMKAGTLTIEPVEVEIVTSLGPFQSGRTLTRSSAPVALEVKPLPAQGQPPGFAATNVGDWALEAEADATRTAPGQPVTFTLTARGTGNLEALELPELEGVEGFRVYEPTRTLDPKTENGAYGGEKRLEWILVPTRSGRLQVPSLTLSTFDPATGDYRTVRTEPVAVQVEAGSGAGAGGGAPGVAANLLEADGVRPIRYSAEVRKVPEPVYRRPVFYAVLVLPVLGFAAASGWGRARSLVLGPQRRTAQALQAGLAQAGALARRGEAAQAAAAVERTLLAAIEARWGLSARGYPRRELAAALEARGASPGQAAEAVALLEACEHARYAPAPPSGAEVSILASRAGRLLQDVGLLRQGGGRA